MQNFKRSTDLMFVDNSYWLKINIFGIVVVPVLNYFIFLFLPSSSVNTDLRHLMKTVWETQFTNEINKILKVCFPLSFAMWLFRGFCMS